MIPMVKKTSLALKVERAIEVIWPSPVPTPTVSAMSTTIQAPNRLSRSVMNRLGRIAGRTTFQKVWRRVAPMMRATWM